MDLAVKGQDEKLALGILAERGDMQWMLGRVDQLAAGDELAVPGSQAPDPAGFVVAVDVDAHELWQGFAAVDIAPGDTQAVVLA